MATNGKSGNIAPEQLKEKERSERNEDIKTRLEEKEGAKIIKYEELIDIAPDFAIWLKSIVRYGNVDSQVLIYWYLADNNRFKCLLYTNDHKYSITGYPPTEKNPRGYLGCIASVRKPRPGEDWTRGNDLPDGHYSKETFDKIVHGILAYEWKNLQIWH